MFRFIKMWLLLRVLSYQQEHLVKTLPDFVEQYDMGAELFGSQKKFVQESSQLNIYTAILPKVFRRKLKPKTKDELRVVEVNRLKIKEFDSLINFAKEKKYIDDKPKAGANSVEVLSKAPREMNDPIRVSETGDQFITYAGGLEALITEFPKLWAIIGLSLIPWIYTNHHWLISIYHLLLNRQ